MLMSALLLLWTRDIGSIPVYGPFVTANAAAGAQAVNRSSVSSLAFLVWDILITTDDEVKLIWPRTLSYTKIVYFIVRYLPMLVQVYTPNRIRTHPHFHFTPHDCYIWQIYQGVAASTIITTVETILILRVHALYHGNTFMRRVVAAVFVLEIVGMVVGLSLALPGITYDDVCLVVGVPRSLIIYAGSSIIFQSFLFAITSYKFILAARSGWGDVPLIVLLMRDGTWAFFLLFIVYVGQISLYALSNPAFSGILYGWLLTAFSFSGYRILLNLNHLAEHTNGTSTRNSRPTNTNIQFSTRLFESQRYTNAQEQDSYELSPRSEDVETQRRYHDTQISTLSLGQ